MNHTMKNMKLITTAAAAAMKLAALALWVGGVNGFVVPPFSSTPLLNRHLQMTGNSSDLPYGPPLGSADLLPIKSAILLLKEMTAKIKVVVQH